MNDDLNTRESLLARLKHGSDEADWVCFYSQYNGVILNFCRRQGLDDFASWDVLQETMILLIRKLPELDYDPGKGRFRNLLLTLVVGKIRDARRRQKRAEMVSLDDKSSGGYSAHSAHLSVEPEVNQTLEYSWMESLVEEALHRIQEDPRIKPETITIFRALRTETVADIARRFQMQENAIYQIKNRLMKRIREEISSLMASASKI
jgi:RNA polymerase sigma factor (sigma-70 family)